MQIPISKAFTKIMIIIIIIIILHHSNVIIMQDKWITVIAVIIGAMGSTEMSETI